MLELLTNIFTRKKHHSVYTIDYDLDIKEIESNRDKILSLLKSTGREGIDNVIEYMDNNNFFIVPASPHHHHRGRGGLAQHSLSVYEGMMNEGYGLPGDSIIIAGLLHDICKTDKFTIDKEGILYYTHAKNQGRGRRSIKILLKCGLRLTESERLAIRWHMGGDNAETKEEIIDAGKAMREELWDMLFKADCQDSGREI